ncbi:MAG: hypothetical protein ABIH23_16805 [bacterium]
MTTDEKQAGLPDPASLGELIDDPGEETAAEPEEATGEEAVEETAEGAEGAEEEAKPAEPVEPPDKTLAAIEALAEEDPEAAEDVLAAMEKKLAVEAGEKAAEPKTAEIVPVVESEDEDAANQQFQFMGQRQQVQQQVGHAYKEALSAFEQAKECAEAIAEAEKNEETESTLYKQAVRQFDGLREQYRELHDRYDTTLEMQRVVEQVNAEIELDPYLKRNATVYAKLRYSNRISPNMTLPMIKQAIQRAKGAGVTAGPALPPKKDKAAIKARLENFRKRKLTIGGKAGKSTTADKGQGVVHGADDKKLTPEARQAMVGNW